MANWDVVEERIARKYGLNPRIFKRQIRTESNNNPHAVSPAGARGIAQLMPETAAGMGVNPDHPREALHAAAKMDRDALHRYGGDWRKVLTAYNAGPGRVGKPLYAETAAYIQKILGGGDPMQGAPAAGGSESVTLHDPGATVVSEDPELQRKQFFASWLQQHKPNSLLLKLGAVNPNMSTLKTTRVPGSTSTISLPTGGGHGGGHGAVGFARGHLNRYAESAGFNRGPELDTLERRFGMTGQAWCAMFATTAAAHGGASRAVRTPSVAQINQWASEGSHGYAKGLRHGSAARAGDLMTFGDHHVGVVESVHNGVITTIEGNTSSGKVTRRTHSTADGRIARPLYR